MKLLVLIAVLFSLNVQSQEMGDHAYLRKLSLHLRGLSPELSEYTALEKAQNNLYTDLFFREKIDEYISSPEFVERMTDRLNSLFLVSESSVPFHKRTLVDPEQEENNSIDYPQNNSMDRLFRDMIQGNLTWDTLLTGKNYYAYPMNGVSFGRPNDISFYKPLKPELPTVLGNKVVDGEGKPVTEAIPVQFHSTDPRIAGAITTSRFTSRYVNNFVNKNRKRAAAVYRIFLCDSMSVQVEKPKDFKKLLLDLAYPSKGITLDEIKASLEDQHGSDPGCMACHMKLDPLAKSFNSMSSVLSPRPSKGEIVIPNTDKVLEGKGIGELAEKLTRQEEYLNCQITHFWNWYIGEDIPLEEDRMTELRAVIDSADVARKTKEIVKVMVQLQEFKGEGELSEAYKRALKAKGLMQRCDQCHFSHGVKFAKWPINGSSESMKDYLGRIALRLDFAGNGQAKTMPPSENLWQPSTQDILFLKQWVADGAPDFEGQPQISGGENE